MEWIKSNQILMTILANHKIPAQTVMDQIEIAGTDVKLQAKVFGNSQGAKGSIQLDIVVVSQHLLGGSALVESFAGVGSTFDEAVNNAFNKFCRASLHVIMAVFIDRSLGEDQVEWENWSSNQGRWDVSLGPLLLQADQSLGPDSSKFNFSDLLDAFRDALVPRASHEAHWLRCFRGSLNGKCLSREVLLDNDPWAPGEAILDHWAFPNISGFYSLRHFLFMLPV